MKVASAARVHVLDGVIFHTGQVVVCWRTDVDQAAEGYSSLGIYPSWEAFRSVHIDSHPANQTTIVWSSGQSDHAASDPSNQQHPHPHVGGSPPNRA